MRKGLNTSVFGVPDTVIITLMLNVVTILPGAVLLYGLQYTANLHEGNVMVYWGNVLHPGNIAYHTEDKNNLTATSHETLQKPIKTEVFSIFIQNSNFRGKNQNPSGSAVKRPNTDCEASALELEEYKPTTTSSLQQLTSAPICIKYTFMSFTWFLCLKAFWKLNEISASKWGIKS